MAKTKNGEGGFPHVKGLAKKRTKNGHRWILTEPDFSGVPRSITVKILDNDPVDVFFRKVNDARQELRRRCECKDFSEYVEAYISMNQLADWTAKEYRRQLKGFSFDDKKNTKLVNEILKSKLRPYTMKVYIGRVNTFFKWLIMRGEPVKNPTCNIVIKAQIPRRTRTLDDAEMSALLSYLRKRDMEYRLFGLLLINTGARASTIGQLTPNSLDSDSRLHLYNVKSKKRYDYELPLKNEEVLSLWQDVGKDGVLWHKPWKLYHFRLTNWMRQQFGKDANGEHLSVHSIRHTFATNAIRNGVPLEVVSKLLDHSSPAITLQVYAKFSQEQIDDAVIKATKKPT